MQTRRLPVAEGDSWWIDRDLAQFFGPCTVCTYEVEWWVAPQICNPISYAVQYSAFDKKNAFRLPAHG